MLLSGRTPACNSCYPDGCCWALILRDGSIAWFSSVLDVDDRLFNVDDDDLDEPEELPFEVVAAGTDEVGLSGSSTLSIPQPIPWPDSWVRLVSTARSLGRPSFREIFSGIAMPTSAFRGSGISCAPPVDVLSDPEYSLLNASFLAVIVGPLAGHLIDLLHLAPPCAYFSVKGMPGRH